MNHFRRLFIACSVLAFGLLACGASPLLNHRNAWLIPQNTQKLALMDTRCAFSLPAHGLCAELVWVKDPAVDPTGEVLIRFTAASDPTGPEVDPGFDVALKLWMPSMGHGSSPVRVSRELDSRGDAITGVYRGTPVYFVMGGAWEIWLQLKSGSTVVEQASVPYLAQ